MSPRSTSGKQQRVTNLPWNEYCMVHCRLTTARISSDKNPNMFVKSLNGDGYEICRRGWRVLSYAAHNAILYTWACAPCANVIARKIPGPAAGATTYVEREPAQAENLRQAEEGLDIPLKGLQTALTWAHDFAAKAFSSLFQGAFTCLDPETN